MDVSDLIIGRKGVSGRPSPFRHATMVIKSKDALEAEPVFPYVSHESLVQH